MTRLLVLWGCITYAFIELNLVKAQFPRACATRQAYLSHECCPNLSGVGSPCGEAEGRGLCVDIIADDQPWSGPYNLNGIDDRERWPMRFFNRSCQCVDNFAGFDCSFCKPGLRGENCTERQNLAVRKDIMKMPRSEAIQFLEILDQSDSVNSEPNYVDVSIYDLFVWVHYYSVRDTLLGGGETFTDIDFSHEGPGFLTWHRMHLLNLEDDLRRMTGNPDLAIPYWNFAIGGSTCDACTDDLLGGRHPENDATLSPNSRFADWEVVCLSLDWYNENIKLCNGTGEGPIWRNPGGNVDRPAVQTLPDPADVSKCLQVAAYDTFPYFSSSDQSFRNTLEGYAEVDGKFSEGARTLHNLAHLFLNGTGGQTHASANDPLFVLLHAFTDAIFDEWLKREDPTFDDFPSSNAPIGHNLGYNMVPFFPPVKNMDMFVQASQLGYTYDIEFIEAETMPQLLVGSVGIALLLAVMCLLMYSIKAIWRCHKRSMYEKGYQRILAAERQESGYNYE